MPYYAVVRGRNGPEIYESWDECADNVLGYSGAYYRKFNDYGEACEFMDENCFSYSDEEEYEEDYEEYYQEYEEPWNWVYVDGACSNNGYHNARAGIGGFFGNNDPKNFSLRCWGRQTNNSAEIQAATHAIAIALEQGWTKLRIYTDSEYLIERSYEIFELRANNWYSSNHKLIDNWEELEELSYVMDEHIELDFIKVRAHSDNYGNEMADRLARQAARY